MKRHWAAILVLVLSPLFLDAQTLFVVNSQSRTLSRIDLSTDIVNNNFASLGNIPNKVLVTEDHLWVVNSGDNSLQKISAHTGSTLANHFVAIGSNPWDCVLHNGYLYITGLMTSKVYKMDALTGTVVNSVNVGVSPGALFVQNGKLYVCNAGNYVTNYAGSSVSVVDLGSFSVINTIPSSANPQYLAEHNGLIHVSCTGNWSDIAGAICVIDPATDELIQTIPIGGTPSKIWINPIGIAYVGDGNGSSLYSYNANDFSLLNPAANPLALAASEVVGNSSMIALLSPQWGENATLRILHPDLSPWKNFTVRMMPTDLKLQNTASGNGSEVNTPPALMLYPNPAKTGAIVTIFSKESDFGQLEIYNIRGQMVGLSTLIRGKAEIPTAGLPSGAYFYKLNTAEGNQTGRFVVTQ